MKMMTIFDFIMIALGAYILYMENHMKTTGKVPEFFIPKEEMKKCKNTEAFIKFLHPRLCIFAVVDIGFGMEEIMNAVGYTISNRMNCIFILCFLGIWIWFTLMMNKARKEFFY